MDVNLFDKFVRYISTRFEVVQLERFLLSGGLLANKEYATILFDDGYKDNIQFAEPILQKYGCPASFYVVTECIEKNIVTWTQRLDYSFQHTNRSKIDLCFNFLPSVLRASHLNSQNKRMAYVKKLKPYLKTLPHEERNLVLEVVSKSFSDVDLPQLMMDWNDLRALKSAGHYIGSHTTSHCMLATMSDESEISRELRVSGELIKERLGHFPSSIAYPLGSYNQNTVRLSKEAGYQIGLAVKQDLFNPLKDSIFEIPRIELYNEPWWKAKLRITNSLERFKSLIGYK